MDLSTVNILALGLVIATLAIMASRTLAPVKEEPKGRVELDLALPFMQRAMSQRMNVISICAVLAISGGALTTQRIVSPVIGFLALAVMFGLISKRQRLVLTSQGVLVHNAAFRSWKDFDGFRVGGSKVHLSSSTRLASLSLYIPSSRRDEVAAVLRRHVSPATPTAPRSESNRRRRTV